MENSLNFDEELFGEDTWVRPYTGEVAHGVLDVITRQKVEEEQQKQENQKNGYKYYLNNILPLPTLLQQEYGNFIHTRYYTLLDKINDDTATAFRFIYLCTFMDYDTGYIIWKGRKIREGNLIDIFDLGKTAFTKTKNSLLEYELIYSDKDGHICINTDYSYKGDIKRDRRYKKQCTRIFNNSIQELYNNSDPREHKLIGKFILLLPYINIWHNIICLNPKEKDISKLELPNSEQMDQILNVSSRNSNKIINELFQITVGGERAMLVIMNKYSVKMYVVNPRIYYSGTNMSDLEELIGYFKAKGGLD